MERFDVAIVGAGPDPMVLFAYIQAQHIDLDFYDKYYRPGAYTPAHRDHMKKWHKKEMARTAKAA